MLSMHKPVEIEEKEQTQNKYTIQYQDPDDGEWITVVNAAVGLNEAINAYRSALLGLSGHLSWRLTSPQVSETVREL